jgi:glycosyltransferase involved in cell wall biosynthesis
LVDPLDVPQIAAAMRKLLVERPLRDKLVARGLERAKDFSWEKCAQEVLSMFDTLNTRRAA